MLGYYDVVWCVLAHVKEIYDIIALFTMDLFLLSTLNLNYTNFQ